MVRFGIPPKSLKSFISENSESFSSTQFIAAIVNGLVYAAQLPDAGQMLNSALQTGGYAVRIFGEKQPGKEVDKWNYIPDSLALMGKLKSKWDPDDILNPGTFLTSEYTNQD